MSKKTKTKRKIQKKRIKKNQSKVKEKKLPSKFKRILGAITLTIGAVVIGLSFFQLSGPGGEWLRRILWIIGGRTAFLTPFFLIALAILLIQKWGRRFFWIIIVGMALIEGGLTSLLAITKISGGGYTQDGGWLGQILIWPVFHLFGLWISLLFALAMIIAGLISFSYPFYIRRKTIQRSKSIETTKKQSSKPVISPTVLINKKEKFSSVAPKVNLPSFQTVSKNKQISGSPKQLKKGDYVFPLSSLLEQDQGKPKTGDIQKNSLIIKNTLADFGVPIKMVEVNVGPTVTQYAFRPFEGIKLSKITALSKNISLALAAHPIRIEAPIPGKSLVGVEVPNQNRMVIHLRNLIENSKFKEGKTELGFCLGRDVRGEAFFADLAKMPHLLVAGATGAGKTVFLNDLIISLLYKNSPQTMQLVLVDPKQVEFSAYEGLPHLLAPVISDFQKTALALEWLVEEMERRFHKIAQFKVRDIYSFNRIARSRTDLKTMPFLVVVIDELADLMVVKGREIEALIVRLAQKSRAVGIHLVLATQRPSVEVITGLIKANISCRISFQVASQIDSRTILDCAGAEKLLGGGDMLFLTPRHAKPKRIQAPFISEKEVSKVVDFIKQHNAPRSLTPLEEYLTQSIVEQEQQGGFASFNHDPLYEKAKEVVISENKASASLLQRRLAIGYARAARLLDMLESEGIVGPSKGAKPRDIIFNPQQKNNEEENKEEF